MVCNDFIHYISQFIIGCNIYEVIRVLLINDMNNSNKAYLYNTSSDIIKMVNSTEIFGLVVFTRKLDVTESKATCDCQKKSDFFPSM